MSSSPIPEPRLRVVASETATSAVHERGGQLWVWTKRSRCCGAVARLGADTVEHPGRSYRRVAEEPFEVLLASAEPGPEELHVELGRRGRLSAYWNGCAWVV